MRVNRRLLLTLAAGTAAFAINSIPGLMAYNLGRAVSLPVAILFGPWFGLLAGALAGLPFATSLPSRLSMLLLEGLVIGYTSRHGRSPIIVATLFWAVVAVLFSLSSATFGQGYAAYQGPLAWTYALQRNLTLLVSVVVAMLKIGRAHV